eukprot:4426909-Alexandrium_andersonii.AAC.1
MARSSGWTPRPQATTLQLGAGAQLATPAVQSAVCTELSPWFSVRLSEAVAPWAFVKGAPSRAMSTLELLAATVGFVLLATPALGAPGVAGNVGVTDIVGFTDSQ